MPVRCGDIHGMTVPSQRSYHSDLADKSVKFWTAPTKARRAVLERDAKNGTMGAFGSQSDDAGQSPSVASLCFAKASSASREMRSRAESSQDDNIRRLWDSIVGANGCSPETALRLTIQEIQ